MDKLAKDGVEAMTGDDRSDFTHFQYNFDLIVRLFHHFHFVPTDFSPT